MDAKILSEITKWSEETDLEEIIYKKEGDGFSIQNGFTNLCNFLIEPSIINLNSTYVGIFRPSKIGQTLNIKEGDSVLKGDVIGYVEVLREYKEIISPVNGIVKSVCLKDGECAQYNTALFFIEKR